MITKEPHKPAFELRKGWNWESVLLCLFAAAMVALGFGDPGSGISILLWVLFGGGLVVIVAGALRRRWFFRADADGPAIRASTVRGERIIQLPWDQVQAVIVWKAAHNRWIGVVPRPGVVVATAPQWVRGAARLVAGDAAQMCTMLHGVRPDLTRLDAILDEVAPHVALADYRSRRPVIHRHGNGTNPFA